MDNTLKSLGFSLEICGKLTVACVTIIMPQKNIKPESQIEGLKRFKKTLLGTYLMDKHFINL